MTVRPAGIFESYGPRYAEAGLAVIPTRQDDPKMPAVKWRHFQAKPPLPAVIDQWAKKRPNDNVGLITGAASNLTVVDVDHHRDLAEAISIFGETPVVVRSPRPEGGAHLYFRHNGERNATDVNGLKIDLRGEGGIIVAPPVEASPTSRRRTIFSKAE